MTVPPRTAAGTDRGGQFAIQARPDGDLTLISHAQREAIELEIRASIAAGFMECSCHRDWAFPGPAMEPSQECPLHGDDIARSAAKHYHSVVTDSASQGTLASEIDGSIAGSSVKEQIAALPLKEMEASLLRSAILDNISKLGLDSATFRNAIDLASYLHRNQTRQNRGNMPKVHYIEHPLRGSLRLLRYGVTDSATLVGAILHDTVEDHAQEMAAKFGGVETDSEYFAREAAFSYLKREFGGDVAEVVRAMSNPLKPEGLTREEANTSYLNHVLDEITAPRVFLCKFADFADNALSLHHSQNPTMTRKLATKYLPLVDHFRSRIGGVDLTAFVGREGIAAMRAHLEGNRLAEFAAA